MVSHLSLIRAAERYLEAHVPSEIVRHAAETQAILTSWRRSETVQVAALIAPLLHQDIMDDESLKLSFGERPVKIASDMVRFGLRTPHDDRDPEEAYALKLRDLYTCAYVDKDSVLLCAASRQANVSSLDGLSPEEQRRWASETLHVDVPLYELLGMWTVHHNMANLALHLIDEPLFRKYVKRVNSYYKQYRDPYWRLARQLDHALQKQDIKADIKMHETTPASIYLRQQRMEKQGHPQNDPKHAGPLRIDVLVNSPLDCYGTLGVIHRLWLPYEGAHVRDEIAQPRYNGFRALITHFDYPLEGHPVPVEFRILTHAMAQTNAKGLVSGKAIKNAWWTDEELAKRLDIQHSAPLGESIAVFVPGGQVIYPLPYGSTVVDVAFTIDPEMGPYARRFIVNGKQQPYDYRLSHRDLVEIIFEQSYPSITPWWEHAALTPTAYKQIQEFLKTFDMNTHKGRMLIDAVLERECSVYNMRFTQDQVTQALERAARRYRADSAEGLYALVASSEVAPNALVADMIEAELVLHVRCPDDIIDEYNPKIELARSWMQEPPHRRKRAASRILPGVDIVGHLTKDRRRWKLTVHRADSKHAPPANEQIPLSWEASKTSREAVQVTALGPLKMGIERAVLTEVYRAANDTEQSDLLIYNFHAYENGGMMHIEFTLDTARPEYLDKLRQNLGALQSNKLVKEYRIWQLFPGQRLLLAGLSDRRHQNPFTPSHIQDKRMFYGREQEVSRIVRHIQDEQTFIILHGHQRIGKTSLMVNLARYILPQMTPTIPVIFNMHDIAPVSAYRFAKGLIEAAQEAASKEIQRAGGTKRIQYEDADLQADPLRTLVNWVKEAEQHIDRRLYFLVDEFTVVEDAYRKGDLDDSFFQKMDHITDRQQIAMMLCIHDNVMRNDHSKLSNTFQRGQSVYVGELDENAARLLISQPLQHLYDIDYEVLDRMIWLTNSHPYYIQTLCSELFGYASMNQLTRITLETLRHAETRVLDSSTNYFSHYKNATDAFGWEVLKAIALLSGAENKHWVSVDLIETTVLKTHHDRDKTEVQQRLHKLRAVGAIISPPLSFARGVTQTEYRIPLGLLHMRLREGTHRLPTHLARQIETGQIG